MVFLAQKKFLLSELIISARSRFENCGKIISLIEYTTNVNNIEIEALSKNLCMHIAAMKPESIDIDDLDKNLINNEEKIQKELILNSGKPSNIVEKILEGKMKKYFSEVTLLNQSYILDQDKTVRDIINGMNIKNLEALANPACLSEYENIEELKN